MKLLPFVFLFLSPFILHAQWEQVGQTVLGEEDYAYFGEAVSMSDDGSTVAVSAPLVDSNGLEDNGQVRVYRLVGNVWTQVGSGISGEFWSEGFGNSLSLSADGNILAIGSAWGDEGYGYVKVFELIDDEWALKGSKLTGPQEHGNFGICVSLSDDGLTLGVARDGFNGSYGAHVYEFDGNAWVNTGGPSSSYSVKAITMSGDGTMMIYGGQNFLHPTRKIDGVWTVLSNMSVGTGGISSGSNFLSISGDGNVWAWGGENWDNQATDGGRITIIDMTDPDNWDYSYIYGSSFNHLGRSVSLNYDGTVMATLGGQNRIYKLIDGEWVNSYTIPEASTRTSLNGAGDMLAIGTNEFDNSEFLNVGRMLVYGDLPNTPPTMDCPPNMTVSTDAGLCGAVVEFSAINANDAEDGPLTSVQTGGLASGELFPLGSSTVTFTATDSGGLTVVCQYEIIVVDNESPQAFCNNFTAELDEDGIASISADEVNNGSTDNCEISTYELSTSDFSCEDLGISTVELIVTDNAGNQGVCPAIVTVVDLIAPVAMCQYVNLDLGEDGTVGIEVEDLDNGSFDNCDFELTASMLEFDCGNLGQIPVVLTATDASGNSSTCSTEVTVSDATVPSMTCQDITVSLDENGEGSLVTEDIDNGSFDNCLIALGVDITEFTCDDIVAPVEVTLTGTDFAGNQATCTSMVTIVDEIAPEVICPDDFEIILYDVDAFILDDLFAEGLISATDNCDGVIVFTQDPAPGTELLLGDVYTISVTATDESLNSATCTTVITADHGLAVEESGFSSFLVMPNPAQSSIQILGLADTQNVEVVNALGNVLLSESLSSKGELNIEQLSTGIYFVRLGDGGMIRFVKL